MEWHSSALSKASHKKSDRYLHINNCGFYKGLCQGETQGSFRPFGLPDYQLIYLTEGSMSFLINGMTKILSAGDIIIYPPDTPQKYRSISESGTSYIWVHFTGFAAPDILSSSGFSPEKIYSAWSNSAVFTTILKMSDELRIKRAGSEEKANGLFLGLLAFLARELKSERKAGNRYSRILPALRDMENGTGLKRSNEEYAEMCGLTPYYFIHLFKEVTGQSPIKYISEANMKKAEYLLTETGMGVADIARLTGFESPSYFTKRFRERTGMTPSEYREKENEK